MGSPKTRLNATIALALSGAMAIAGLATAAPSAAITTPANADAAAGWLAGEFVDGKIPSTWTPGTTDWGLTADAILALTSRKVAAGAAATATDALRDNVYDYISPAGGDSRSAGAVAKVALVAQVQGRDATTFHDVDLIANLSSLKSTTAPNVGRFRDNVAGSDYSGSFSQSLALLALSHWGSVPADAVQWLVGLQCANGGYPFSPDEATGHCASNADADNDATAMAIQALVASGVSGQPGVAAALEKAADFLASVQASDGSFDAPPWQGANASTTGLVGQSMRLAGRTAVADRAADWLAGLQVDCTNAATGVGAAARGAIAYDPAGLTAVLTTGVDNSNSDQLRRTTAQAILGLPGSDSYSAMSAAGSSASVPSLTCTQPRTAPLSPTVTGITYAASLKSATVATSASAGASVLFRVKKGSAGSWGAWNTAAAGSFLVPASKTARYVEVIARDGGNDSPAVTVLVQARNSSASRRGCQALGAVSITAPVAQRATATFAARAKACASWRLNGKGKWKTVKRGATSVNFAVKSAVGVNWEFRTGRRTVAISVRAPR